MRPFGGLAPFEEVRRVLAEMAVSISDSEITPLSDATGRVLASDASSAVDVPNADRAAMDGFAARASDTASHKALRLIGRIAAGDVEEESQLNPGECVEIATGAPLPTGADCVVPVEHALREEGAVTADSAFVIGQHVSRQAEDLAIDQVVASAGQRLHPSRIAACAASGVTEVEVLRAPRVRVMSSGDEVIPLGEGPLAPGQVYDSNASALTALFTQLGCIVDRTPIVADDRDALRESLRESDVDLTITIGGTSVGRRDLVSDVVDEVGEIHLHGVAVRPGKPLLLATVNNRPLVGLPGFPTSCLMMAYVTAVPLVRKIGHLETIQPPRAAVLTVDVESPADKTHFLPVQLDGDRAIPTFTFSSAVSSMAAADGWIEIAAEDTHVAAGSQVEVTLY